MHENGNGRLDARDFGVRADGEHDDAEALQAAIDALPDSGGKVLLPSGRMRCSRTLVIRRPFVTIEGVNCGLRSKACEPEHIVGQGSLLLFDADCDGVVVEPPRQQGKEWVPRLGGVALRDFGISGTGKSNGCRAVVVHRGRGRKWGSTDALLLERLYTIEFEWAAYLQDVDATIVSNCWLSECGNGLHLENSVYANVTNCCFADTDGIGALVEGGKSNEFASCIFVRNVRGLEIDGSPRTRINGGCVETDGCVGERNDLSLVRIRNSAGAIVAGTAFSSAKQHFDTAIDVDAASNAEIHACTISGSIDCVV